MKRIFFALTVVVVVFFISACNGKVDQELIDSITGKISVEKITIDQEDFEMTEGESTVLTATVLPADATDKTVSWNSSKEDVVMISNTGKAMAMTPGKSVITAKAGNKTDFITITVIANTVPVTGISLDKTSIVLKLDESEMLTATITPENATNKNVSWTSSDATVATVENGKVTGVKPGSVTITANTEDGNKTAECAVTVKTNLVPSVTVGYEKLSAVSVVLKGKANIGSSVSADLEMGILYSLNEGVIASNSTRVKASNMDGDFNYSVNVTLLDPATTYYFRSYVTQNGQDTYGETKSFTTKELSSMIHTEDASNISAVSAILNGSYDLTDVQYTAKTIGLYYGASAESLSENYIAEISSISGDFSEIWPVLKPATEYFYQVYINLDNKLYKEEVKSFSTNELSSMLETKDASDISPTSAKMNAMLDLTNVQRTTMEYGFYWGTSESSQTTYVKGGDVAGNAYSASLSGLSHKTQYWYKAYLKVDGQQFDGMVKTFTTEVVPVTSVSLNKNEYTFNTIGNTFTLTPTVLPSDATNKVVSWESSKTSVATVDANGKVTAKGNGSATITVTTKDQSKKATCIITVAQYVTSITLNKSTLTLNEGQTETLSATIAPDNANDKTLTWSSSNTSVATVDQTGKVTAVSKGTATITATAKDGSGKSASCSLTVNRLVSSISLNKTSTIIYKGKTETLTATVSPSTASNTGVTWSSSNTSVATVSSSGVVTGVARGTATITAAAKDGSGKSAICSVEVKQHVTSITLNKSTLTLNEGQTETLSATIAPDNANDKTLTWSSSNTSVATVDQTGKVTAVSKGTATITATAKDGSGKSASCSITVKRLVSSISLNKTSTIIYNGKTETLTATVSPSTASNTGVTWSSSNTSVATVSSSGVVTGVARGTATITAAAKDGSGKSASCQVEVKQYVTGITLDITSLVLVEGKSETLTVTSVNPDNANDKTYTWSSSNTSVATVDQTGKVTAVSKGRATISATAKDGSGVSASCCVYVSPVGKVDMGFATTDGKIVYWATSNLSESGLCAKPEDYGDYYAWGETEPYYESGYAQSTSPVWKSGKTGYNEASYKWCNGSSSSLTKYNTRSEYGSTVDNKKVLEADDDVAHVKLGGSWRMPTYADWDELLNTNNCTWEWTTQNGINGYKVTSKKNGASIFLPAAGDRGGASLYDVGSRGKYWSSSLYPSLTFEAFYVHFNSDRVFRNDGFSRYFGQSVRPVSE